MPVTTTLYRSIFACRWWTLLGLSACLTAGLGAQSGSGLQMAKMAGIEIAGDYGQWVLPVAAPVTAVGVPVTLPIPNPQVVLPGGLTLEPLATGTPLQVGAAGTDQAEVVIPVVSSCPGLAEQVCLTATFTHLHPSGLVLSSASHGLQEAINSSHAEGGGTVRISPDWRSGVSDILNATFFSDVLVEQESKGAEVWYGLRSGKPAALATVGSLDAGITAASLQAASLEKVLYADQYCASPGVLDQTCLQGAVEALASAPGTIFVPAGQYAIAADITIPSNVTLQFARGAVLTVAVPYVVQINGPVSAGNAQIFSTTLPLTASGAMAGGANRLSLASATLSAVDVGAPVYVAGTATANTTILYDDVLAGIGDGTTMTFHYTAQHVPLIPSKIEALAGTAWGEDNGGGGMVTGAGSSAAVSGTVDYATGSIAATFAIPPPPGSIVEVGYQSQQFQPQVGTILAVQSGTSATVSFTAAQSVSAASVYYGGSYVKFGPGFVGALNPAWWGAVGDGATDDTTALQASLIACGESQHALHVPGGTYEVRSSLEAGDPFQVGLYQASGQVEGQCSIVGQAGGTAGGAREAVVFQAAAGFPSGDFVLRRENSTGVLWRDFEVDGSGTGANGIDGSWWETVSGGSPAASNLLINVNVFNYGRLALALDNWNDSVIREDTVAQATGPAPIAFQINAGGGKLDLFGDRAYNGVVRITAQNANLNGGGFYDGLQLISQGINSTSLTGVQVFPNAATGIAVESTSSSSEGSEYLSCDACWLTAGAGQSFIAGKWGIGASFVNSTFYATSGAPNMFGAISGPLAPQFYFAGADLRNGAVLNTPATGQVYSFNQSAGLSGWQSSGPFRFGALGSAGNAGAVFVGCPTTVQATLCVHAATNLNLQFGTQSGALEMDALDDGFTVPVPLDMQANSFTFRTGMVHFAGGAAITFDGGATVPAGQTLANLGLVNGSGSFDLSQTASLSLPASYNANGHAIAQPAAAGTLAITSQLPLSATSATFAPGALTAGVCVTQATTAIPGVAASMTVAISPQSDPGAGILWQGLLTTTGVAIRECNMTSGPLTPAGVAYNIRVLP